MTPIDVKLSKMQQKMVREVREHPGSTVAEIQERTGDRRYSILGTLQVLRAFGHVTVRNPEATIPQRRWDLA